uniref:Uncharacterized protein n=1 Tax=Zooxanthella nutricula TaxID=1333877 RepID=A0A7S2HJW9_9DINO
MASSASFGSQGLRPLLAPAAPPLQGARVRGMACCAGCTPASRVWLGAAACWGAAGAVLLAIACTVGIRNAGDRVPSRLAEGAKFEVEDQRSFELTAPRAAPCHGGEQWGFIVYVPATADCSDAFASTTARYTGGGQMVSASICGSIQEPWEQTHSPPLRRLGQFFLEYGVSVGRPGSFRFASAAPMWVVGACVQAQQAVPVFFGVLPVLVLALIALAVSCIFCIVGCRSMGSAVAVHIGEVVHIGKVAPPVVVGQPKVCF